jgi:hypothetical protein
VIGGQALDHTVASGSTLIRQISAMGVSLPKGARALMSEWRVIRPELSPFFLTDVTAMRRETTPEAAAVPLKLTLTPGRLAARLSTAGPGKPDSVCVQRTGQTEDRATGAWATTGVVSPPEWVVP